MWLDATDRIGRAAAARRVREALRARLGVGDEVTLTVHELACAEPGCPPVETVVAVHRPGESPRRAHVHQAIARLDDGDLRRLCEQLAQPTFGAEHDAHQDACDHPDRLPRRGEDHPPQPHPHRTTRTPDRGDRE